uniref:Uncharacterized protein n=1 Tax=Romanomermis culicivorax TaxID=13658 RepID=A0A915J2M0_ROMCU
MLFQIKNKFIDVLLGSRKICPNTLETLFPNVFAPRKSIANQLVVITGCGSGLGRLLAVRLAKMGARLALVDENEASNRETEEMVRALTGAQVQSFTCDLGKRKDIYQ